MEDPDMSRRKVIDSIVSNICLNIGFGKTDIFALETLSEMFVACKSDNSLYKVFNFLIF